MQNFKNLRLYHLPQQGAMNVVMIIQLSHQSIVSKFDYNWVPNTSDLVPNQS